jgi:hypothetical protein
MSHLLTWHQRRDYTWAMLQVWPTRDWPSHLETVMLHKLLWDAPQTQEQTEGPKGSRSNWPPSRKMCNGDRALQRIHTPAGSPQRFFFFKCGLVWSQHSPREELQLGQKPRRTFDCSPVPCSHPLLSRAGTGRRMEEWKGRDFHPLTLKALALSWRGVRE